MKNLPLFLNSQHIMFSIKLWKKLIRKPIAEKWTFLHFLNHPCFSWSVLRNNCIGVIWNICKNTDCWILQILKWTETEPKLIMLPSNFFLSKSENRIKEQLTVNNTWKALKIAKLFLEIKESFTQVKVQWTDKHQFENRVRVKR